MALLFERLKPLRQSIRQNGILGIRRRLGMQILSFSGNTFDGTRPVHIRTIDEHGWNPGSTHSPEEILQWIQMIYPTHCWRMLSGPDVNFNELLPNGDTIVDWHQKALALTQNFPYSDSAMSVRVPFKNQDIPTTMGDAQEIWNNFCSQLRPKQKAISIDLAGVTEASASDITRMSQQLANMGYKYISYGANGNTNAPLGAANWASIIMCDPSNEQQYFNEATNQTIQQLEAIGGYIKPYLPEIDFPGCMSKFLQVYQTADEIANEFEVIAKAQTGMAKNIWKIIQLPEWDISQWILSDGTDLFAYTVNLMKQYN